MIIGPSIAMVLSLQSVDQGVVAVRPEDPQTWTLEYPVIIRPLVREYYNCLQSGVKIIDGKSDFESQHRADIPRCAKRGEQLLADAKMIIARSKRPGQASDAELENVFETLRQIHIERGRDIDEQFAMRLKDSARYQDPQVGETASQNAETPTAVSVGH